MIIIIWNHNIHIHMNSHESWLYVCTEKVVYIWHIHITITYHIICYVMLHVTIRCVIL